MQCFLQLEKSAYLGLAFLRTIVIMERKKIHLEYLLSGTSKSVLWPIISTPAGLEGWFADEVLSDDRYVVFCWGKTERRTAEIVAMRVYSFIRFRWLDGCGAHEYFELKMINNELTNDFVLEITDFADEDEAEDQCELWNSQVETLRRIHGL